MKPARAGAPAEVAPRGAVHVLRVAAGCTVDSPIGLDAEQSARLRRFCERHRLESTLVRAVAAGTVAVDAATERHLERRRRPLALAQLRVVSIGVRAYEALADAGVECRVLKGTATRYLDYPEPGLRQVGDVDLLVRSDRAGDAVRVLTAAGAPVTTPLRRGDLDTLKAVSSELDGVEVDLHHRLLSLAPGFLAQRLDLFTDPESFQVGGASLLALPARYRLFHAAAHLVTSFDPQRLWSSIADVHRLLDAYDEAMDALAGTGLDWLLWRGVDEAVAPLGRPGFPRRPPPASARRRLLRWVYADGVRHDERELIAEALVAPPRHTLAAVIGRLAPGEDYLRGVGLTRREHLARMASRRARHR